MHRFEKALAHQLLLALLSAVCAQALLAHQQSLAGEQAGLDRALTREEAAAQRKQETDVLTQQQDFAGEQAGLERTQRTEEQVRAGEQALSQIGAQGVEERASIATSAAENRQTQREGIELSGIDTRRTIEKQATEDIRRTGGTARDLQSDQLRSAEGMQREGGRQALEQIGASGEQDRLNIGAQGTDTRETMREADRLEAGRQGRSTARARALARR